MRKFRPESAKKVIGLTTAISSFRLLHPVIMFLTPLCTDLALPELAPAYHHQSCRALLPAKVDHGDSYSVVD